jgi:hypothetical protein
MMTKARVDARVGALLSHFGGDDPQDLIAALCSDLLQESGASVPVNLEMLASFRNARVIPTPHEQSETIAWTGSSWTIHVKMDDTRGRQRFSCAHAIVHTFFMEAERFYKFSDSGESGSDWSAQEEQLCDLGAAELLLPRQQFMRQCPLQPTMDDALTLAESFEASVEATALRIAILCEGPAAMVVLEPRLKPSEVRAVERRQREPTLPGMPRPTAPTPALRVNKTMGKGLPFIPKHKSIDLSSPFGALLESESIDYVGPTGLIPGQLRISARRLPVVYGGRTVNRIVALLFGLPGGQESR